MYWICSHCLASESAFIHPSNQSEELEARLEALQQRHSELTVLCDGLRKKTEQARTLHPHM